MLNGTQVACVLLAIANMQLLSVNLQTLKGLAFSSIKHKYVSFRSQYRLILKFFLVNRHKILCAWHVSADFIRCVKLLHCVSCCRCLYHKILGSLNHVIWVFELEVYITKCQDTLNLFYFTWKCSFSCGIMAPSGFWNFFSYFIFDNLSVNSGESFDSPRMLSKEERMWVSFNFKTVQAFIYVIFSSWRLLFHIQNLRAV
jgi:hypothetical protein